MEIHGRVSSLTTDLGKGCGNQMQKDTCTYQYCHFCLFVRKVTEAGGSGLFPQVRENFAVYHNTNTSTKTFREKL